jgi:catechol 2,3-dioxygenase-like lactoylglutathione lyase family enzyme
MGIGRTKIKHVNLPVSDLRRSVALYRSLLDLDEPGCWRVGNHSAAGGQFYLCYQRHPDYQGKKPTAELIARLHREHIERQAVVQDRLQEIRQHVTTHHPS